LCRRPFGVTCMINILTLQLTSGWLLINSGCHSVSDNAGTAARSNILVCLCVSNPGGGGGARYFYVLQNVQISCGAHPASYSVGTEVFSPGVESGRDVKLTTHLHLEPRSRMSGAIPLLLLHVLIGMTGRIYLYISCVVCLCVFGDKFVMT
jgi:hypothetical protein